MDKLSAVSDEVCERIIASKFHADVLDYLSSMDKLPDGWYDIRPVLTVLHQLRMLFHVVLRTSAHDDFRQRRAVDIARKFPTLTDHKVIFYRAILCIRGTSHGPASVRLCLSVSVCHKSEFY